MNLRYRLTLLVLTLGAMFSVMSVPGCAMTREVISRLMGRHHTHDVHIDLDPLRDQVDEWIDDASDAVNSVTSREGTNARR